MPIFLPMMKHWVLKCSYVQGGVSKPFVCIIFFCMIFGSPTPSLKIGVSIVKLRLSISNFVAIRYICDCEKLYEIFTKLGK
jgi:hypothetical protein